jgi:hypothetical protein
MEFRAPSLQLDTDESFQRKEWRIQRLGWTAWALVLIGGMAGLLGNGYFSRKTSTAPDGSVTVVYDRFLHYHHPTQLEVTLTAAAGEQEGVQLKLNQNLLDRVQIERIEPEPAETRLAEDGVVYTFNRNSAAGGKIVFFVDFEQYGTSRGHIQLIGREPAVVNQFVYP